MTDILCKWLNEDICLEPKLTKSSFSDVFSNGYLFGEVLYKHGLQPDFAQFSNTKTSEAKLNNFTRLEPTFRLLEIPFNINMARDVMTERPGVATRLLYQLFVALNRVKEGRVTEQSLESMRPSGRVKLEKIETGIFQQRLKQQTPRQVDLNFEELIHKFQERQKSFEQKLSTERKREDEITQQDRRDTCHKSLERSREVRERQSLLYAKLKPLSPSKPPPATRSRTTGSLTERARSRHTRAEAQATKEGIDRFEATLSLRCAPTETRPLSTGAIQERGRQERGDGPSSDYVAQIRKRVQDNELARKEREKRRRKALVEQMQALREQEEARREKVLVERLMRQCQQERRIATQLMAIRKEKETVRNNRIFRLQQYEEQRVREFNEALDRERELARAEAAENVEKLKHYQLVYKQARARKAKVNYGKDYVMCQDMLLLMVDLASMLAHYRELTRGLVPEKLVIDWKTLFIAGKSVYDEGNEPVDQLSQSMASSASSALRKNNTDLLDKEDVKEYREAKCEWKPPDGFTDKLPRPPNTIVAHIVYRLLNMVDPPKPPPSPPKFPKFILRATFIGRPFAGKSTVIRRLEKEFPLLNVLNPEALVTKAVATYLSEKRLLESHLSTEPMEEDQSTTPAISVEPSSTPQLPTATPTAPPTAPPPIPHVEVTNEEEGEPLGSVSSLSDQLLAKLSPLGQLGHRAHTAVTSGEMVDDETVVEVIANEMRTFPDESGFILDNFPITLDQIFVMTKVIFGDPAVLLSTSRNIQLLPSPADLSGEQKTMSDLIMFFDVSTDNVLLRASQTASGKPSSSNKLEQIQHRLLTFDTEWPQARRWTRKYTNIVTVNANQSEDAVYEEVRDKVQEAINQAKHANAMKKLGISRECSQLSSESISDLVINPSKQKRSRSDFSQSPSGRRGRRPSSASMLEAAASFLQAKMASSTSPIINTVASTPGCPDWQYCDLPISDELATGLAQLWPSMETVYLSTLGDVFQQLRLERETICHYFYDKRNEFKLYLTRPDTKQEFVNQWQSSYNSLPVHLRREDLMKAELHGRINDLCEKLWDIVDRRREGAVQERGRVLTDKWLEDHVGLLTNHYITLMQAELDRFYTTFLLLKDYYAGMEDKVPAKLPDPGRLPLLELPPTEPQDLPPSNVSSTHSMQEEAPKREKGVASNNSVTSPKRAASSKQIPKVPLLPRQLLPEPTEDKAPKKKGGVAAVVTPPPPVEDTTGLGLDDQLVVHAYNTAITFVFNTVAHETRALEALIAEHSKSPSVSQPVEAPPPELKEEKGGKGKKDKAKSPAGKKGKASPVKGAKAAPPPPDPVPEVTPAPKLSLDEVAKKQKAVLMYREHKAAVLQEETRVKLRLELIKIKTLQQIETIKGNTTTLGQEMEEWLDMTYKEEMDCVNSLAEVLRQAVENEEKVLQELVLPGASLTIKESCLLSDPTPPASPPPPTEPTHPHIFTVAQLCSLNTQLHTLSPDGFMLYSSLLDTLLHLTERSGDNVSLPDQWASLSSEQLDMLCEGVYGVGADVVDWRRLLVVLAQPWTTPTPQQLVDAVTNFQSVSTSGRVTREQYQRTRTWLDESGEERDIKLKLAFFEMFSDASTDSLEWVWLLLYLCSDPAPGQGLLKALSVVTGRDVTVGNQATVTLDELIKVMSHASCPDDPPPVSTGDLFDLFRLLSPTHPNEVVVCDLVNKESAWDYLVSISPYTLTALEPHLRPASRQTETD